jgi:hypothetical protein
MSNNNFCFIKAFDLCGGECKKECRCVRKPDDKHDSRLNYAGALMETFEEINGD